MKKLQLGVFGFGCVGQGLYEVLNETQGLDAEIKKICIKDPEKSRPIDEKYFTLDPEELLQDPEINVIVELIDDAEAAYDIVQKAIRSGKAVVSANKKMIAENLQELIALQKEFQVPFLYEASCCASIPIIRNLEEYYDHDLLSAVSGIVNGSTNYILSQMNESARDFPEALDEAKSNGFAESDPSLDINGIDACYKLCIILFHSFGLLVKPSTIFTKGITQINTFDMEFARKNNAVIKLLAKAGKKGDQINAWCIPAFVSEGSVLSQTHNEYNSVVLETAFTEQQTLIGKGAGSKPTGSAVLSDISALSYDYKYEFKKYREHLSRNHLVLDNNVPLKIYVRFDADNQPDENDFISIEEKYSGKEANYLIGIISLDKLKHSQWVGNDNISIIYYD